MELIEQLKGLFLEALPTLILVWVFYFFLRGQFFRPILHAIEERAKRTEGARREAEASMAAARQAREEYEAALRKARGEFYAEQEAERRQALEGRMALVRAARENAAAFVHAQKAALEAEIAVARKQLEHESSVMGGEIARALLSGGSGPRVSGGAG
ncbi:MAG TPA: ATP synthase F0 subunit B [Candidatus Acidoferrales bacterium]|nr:ATP synthase F0 subunit B [Candidatus Acidoferrales bacterium]